jgi:hypothetical protein
MRRGLLWLNLAIGGLTLASAIGVLVSDLVVDGYRAFYGDALWFVTAYVVLQAWMLRELWRDSPAVPWVAVLKALAAYAFIVTFPAVGPMWMRVTPARYVYQLFDWGPESQVGLFAFVFLGRGAFNTINAFALTDHWWRPLRTSKPLVGRLVTILPLAIAVSCVWAFGELLRIERETYSAEAREVAEQVLAGLDCDTVRAKEGQRTQDLRQRGEQRYLVDIAYGCRETRVEVHTEDGRSGSFALPRPECCAL